MIKELDTSNGSLNQVESETYWFVTKVKKFPLSVFTESYIINQLVYHVVATHLERTSKDAFDILDMECSDIWDDIDDILDVFDLHMLDTIAKHIKSEALSILKSEEFESIIDNKDIIEKVEYRYEQSDQYVRWFITTHNHP